MATELLSIGTSAASTADIVVVAGTPVTLFLKKTSDGPVDASVAVRATIEIKDSAGAYHEIGALTGQDPVKVLDGSGIFRASRATTTVAFGIEQG